MRSRPAPQIGFSFEYLAWIFTRISGLALILLGILGVVGALIMGARTQTDLTTLIRWTFFPNPNHVVNSDIPDVAVGWASAFWQIMEMMIVFFGVTHGINGLRVVIEDYIGSGFLKILLRGFFLMLWIFLMIVAVYVILAS